MWKNPKNANNPPESFTRLRDENEWGPVTTAYPGRRQGGSVSESEEIGLDDIGKGINITKEVSQWRENIHGE